MRFGTLATFKFTLLLSVGLATSACGSVPGTIRERYLRWNEEKYEWKLIGSKSDYDKPLDYCKSTLCRVYDDKDVRIIEKYIVGLEDQIKELQKK